VTGGSAQLKEKGRVMKLFKVALGSAMLLIAIATISGRDRQAEAWLVNHSPAWLTNLTTRF
jgi:cytochrome c-type biogenesis protein